MPRKKKEVIAPEWSHFVEAEKVSSTPLKITISPNAEERKRLAKRLGLAELKSLEGDLVMSRDSGSNVIFISGHLKADVVQPSVITGKPVQSEIADSFEAWYADPDQAVSFARAKQERLAREGQAGEQPFLDESEDPEPIIEGKIDVGELVAQYLSLAVNPYPQGEDEAFSGGEELQGKGGGDIYENPFSALKNWKQKLEKGES